MKVITTKDGALLPKEAAASSAELEATGMHTSLHVVDDRLTCCCLFNGRIVCGGFSRELFVISNEMEVEEVLVASNSVIRSLLAVSDMLFITNDDGEIIMMDNDWHINTQARSHSPIYKLISFAGNKLISCERSGEVIEWEIIPHLRITKNRTLMNLGQSVFAMGLLDERLIVVNSKGMKHVYNLAKNKEESSKEICSCNVFCLAIDKDEGVYYGLSDGTLCHENGDVVPLMTRHEDAIRDLAFSRDKCWLFSVGKDRTIRAWQKGISILLSSVEDYLYQVVTDDQNIYFVDGKGNLGIIRFQSDIDEIVKFAVVRT